MFLPGELRVVVQPAADGAVEVYYEPVSPVMLRSYEGIEPYNQAQSIAERRAEAYPDGMYWSEGKQVRYDIVPELRRVVNSQAALSRDPGLFGAGIDAEPTASSSRGTPSTDRTAGEMCELSH